MSEYVEPDEPAPLPDDALVPVITFSASAEVTPAPKDDEESS